MIIELQNFGPIKSFKFDTSKDMHAIFGKNNIGKSYAISAVYLILKGLREYLDKIFGTGNHLSEANYDIKNDTIFSEYLTKRSDENDSVFSINDEMEKEVMLNLNSSSLVKTITNSFQNTFILEYIGNQFSKKTFSISITNDYAIIEMVFNESTSQLVVNKVKIFPNIRVLKKDTNVSENWQVQIEPRGGEITLYRLRPTDASVGYLDSFFISTRTIVYYFISDCLRGLDKIYYLPASRSGLYNTLNSFGPIIAELSRNRSFITRKIEIPNIAEPILDYFLNLNTIDKAQANEHYPSHFEEIEQEILKGKITLDNETKKYYYVPTDTDMRLELSFTSSMISEIAPIIAHLKYIIPLESDKPSILFIEEPEAHLHPEIQILLLEYFVKLSKGNVKIVMTSHSNYIFNKLSNLLIANKIDKDKLSVSLMKMTPEGSVIEEGAMQIDEYGIEDNNFVDVAEQLYEERMSLLEKL